MYPDLGSTVRSLTAVLSTGNLIQVETPDELRMWRHSLGVLGAITSVRLSLFPLVYVQKVTFNAPLTQLLPLSTPTTMRLASDAIFDLCSSGEPRFVLSEYLLAASPPAGTRSVPDSIFKTNAPPSVFAHDNIAMPLLALFPFSQWRRACLSTSRDYQRVIQDYKEGKISPPVLPLSAEWDALSEFGVGVLEVSRTVYPCPFLRCDTASEPRSQYHAPTALDFYRRLHFSTQVLD